MQASASTLPRTTLLLQARPPAFARILEDLLETLGIRILRENEAGCDPSREATPPNVVILDISTSGAGGIDDIRQARNRHADTPIVALSLFGDRHLERAALRAGAAALVVKDRAFETLPRVLRTLFESGSSPA